MLTLELYCIVFIHFYSASHGKSISEALPTTAMLTLCRSLHAEELQATASEGLAQGSYVVARAGYRGTKFQLVFHRHQISTINLLSCVRD